jgi:hypothetical protein
LPLSRRIFSEQESFHDISDLNNVIALGTLNYKNSSHPFPSPEIRDDLWQLDSKKLATDRLQSLLQQFELYDRVQLFSAYKVVDELSTGREACLMKILNSLNGQNFDS